MLQFFENKVARYISSVARAHEHRCDRSIWKSLKLMPAFQKMYGLLQCQSARQWVTASANAQIDAGVPSKADKGDARILNLSVQGVHQ